LKREHVRQAGIAAHQRVGKLELKSLSLSVILCVTKREKTKVSSKFDFKATDYIEPIHILVGLVALKTQ
jgi:hypothetical protein